MAQLTFIVSQGGGVEWRMSQRGIVLQNALTHSVLWSSCPLYDREHALARSDALYRARDFQTCCQELKTLSLTLSLTLTLTSEPAARSSRPLS